MKQPKQQKYTVLTKTKQKIEVLLLNLVSSSQCFKKLSRMMAESNFWVIMYLHKYIFIIMK